MPTYLVCMVVSNLDSVDAPPEPSGDTDIKVNFSKQIKKNAL